MSEARSMFTTGTRQAWSRLPLSLRLAFVIVAMIGASVLAMAAIETPSSVPAGANAAAPAAPARDPSVPDAGQALSGGDRQPEAWTSTF